MPQTTGGEGAADTARIAARLAEAERGVEQLTAENEMLTTHWRTADAAVQQVESVRGSG